MKSQSDERPPVIELLGNGAYYYNYNITEATNTATTDNEGPGTYYDYLQVKLWGAPTRSEIVRAVIREDLDEDEEFNLINSYNAAANGLLDESETAAAMEDYFAHLLRVQEIKHMVKADLTAAGYKD